MVLQAVILAGGLGTRLRSVVSDRPKPMAEIKGRPFLEYQLRYLKKQGVRRAVILCGYKADSIREYFGNGDKVGLELSYSVEKELMGTGGAVVNAMTMLEPSFLLLNGDTFVDVGLEELEVFHKRMKGDVTMTVVPRRHNESRYGGVTLDANCRIIRFVERSLNDGEYSNAGVYVFNKSAFERPLPAAFSLERDFLPKADLTMYAFVFSGSFVDIGTPESYRSFAEHVESGKFMDFQGL